LTNHCGKKMVYITNGLKCEVCGKVIEWGKKHDKENKGGK
jgi:exosome complex RNA-binding protein Csl4